MPRLQCDNDTRATAGDDIAERFQYECRAVQIHFEDRRRGGLRRGYAGSVDKPGHVAYALGGIDERLHRLVRGHVNRRDAHFVSVLSRTSAAALCVSGAYPPTAHA